MLSRSRRPGEAVTSRRALRSERGSASVLMTGIMGVVVAFSSAALLIAGYAVGYHRARAAADLSALSGAAAFQQSRDACVAAEAHAGPVRRNGARGVANE
jgi:uncharacterized protein YjlB